MKGISEDNGGPLLSDEVPSVRDVVRFEIFGQEMIEKQVKSGGSSGKIYLPSNWVGHRVKIIRTD